MYGLQALGKKTTVNGLGQHLFSFCIKFAKISHLVCLFSVSVRYACSSSCGFSIRFCLSFFYPRVHTTVSRVQAGSKRRWRYNNLITSTGFHQGRSRSLGSPSTTLQTGIRGQNSITFVDPFRVTSWVWRSWCKMSQVQISLPSSPPPPPPHHQLQLKTDLTRSNKFLKKRNGLTITLNKSEVETNFIWKIIL